MARIDWSVNAEDIIRRVKETYGASITEEQAVRHLVMSIGLVGRRPLRLPGSSGGDSPLSRPRST